MVCTAIDLRTFAVLLLVKGVGAGGSGMVLSSIIGISVSLAFSEELVGYNRKFSSIRSSIRTSGLALLAAGRFASGVSSSGTRVW